jgi:crotonobetainyl-CoA:carnitine CoA-transferase CaiB-like acyl-CoA transferase
VAAPIYDIKDIFEDPHYLAREDVLGLDDPDLGRIRMLGVMPKFPAMPGKIRWTGKAMGACNQEVYRDLLGMTPADLEALKAQGII